MSALAPCPPLKIAGHEGELVLFADAEGNRVATFASIAAWLGYSSKRPLLKLARRYSADLADLRRVSSVETRGRPRPTQLVDEVGCYVLALVSQTKRGRALRRVLSTWLANSDPSLSSPRTAGELLAIAHRRLRATHRELKALAKTPRPDGALDKDAIFLERPEGVFELRRGFEIQPGQKVLMVEDVVTTGLSSRQAMDAVRAAGGEVLAEVALVDRSAGEADLGVPFYPLVSLNFPVYDPEDIPPELAAIPATKPGSRKN